MSLIGTYLTLLIGPAVPLPAPLSLVENLERVEITERDQGRSGFQMVFRVGRAGVFDVVDYPQLTSPAVRPFNRVILVLTLSAVPRVLMDGVITDIQLDPGAGEAGSGAGRLTLTGEDVSVMMDREDQSAEHPAQPDPAIVAKILLRYSRYGLLPAVIPPKVIDPPLPVERVPVQQATDYAYLQQLAARHGHVFYVRPGPVPGTNVAYWGPPKRLGLQPALSVRMGPASNVRSIDFQHEPLKPARVDGDIVDHRTGVKLPVKSFLSTRLPLASQPTLLAHAGNAKVERYRDSAPSVAAAFGRVQARTDLSVDRTVTARGELDVDRYGDVLRPRSLVGLRGAGYRYDGLYYVEEVTHKIERGDVSQSFTLSREGVGATVPAVLP